MADSTTPITSATDIAAIQLALTQGSALANFEEATAANNTASLSAATQAFSANNISASTDDQAASPTDFSPLDNLVNIDTSTFSLLNEIATDPRSANITGNLTTQQMQEIGILLKDEQGLEEAANLSNPIPLTGGATTVDLSLEAQGIANGISPAAAAGVLAVLTPARLAQIGAILAPLANQPLTPTIFLQIQEQFTAAGFSPAQFNLNSILLVMNYIAAMQPAAAHVIEENNNDRVKRANEVVVEPASSIDRVAVEDSAILSESSIRAI